MPKIFKENEREVIRDKLLDAGLQLLKRKDYRSISIEEITASIGIAKGTFYNFFPSKEKFFYEIMIKIRDGNRVEMIEFFKKGQVTQKQLEEYLYRRYTQIKTVYDYFTLEEIKIIFRRLPKEFTESENDSVYMAEKLFSLCLANGAQGRTEVFVNLLNITAVSAANREMLDQNYFKETIRVLAKTMAAYVFQGE